MTAVTQCVVDGEVVLGVLNKHEIYTFLSY